MLPTNFLSFTVVRQLKSSLFRPTTTQYSKFKLPSAVIQRLLSASISQSPLEVIAFHFIFKIVKFTEICYAYFEKVLSRKISVYFG